MGFLASIVGAVIGPLVSLFGKALAVFAAFRTGKKQGQQESDLRHVDEGAKTQRSMNDADARGPRTGNDAANRMRDGTF